MADDPALGAVVTVEQRAAVTVWSPTRVKCLISSLVIVAALAACGGTAASTPHGPNVGSTKGRAAFFGDAPHFVCRGPGEPWVILASVAPRHSARELQRAGFTVFSVTSNTPEAPFDPADRMVAVVYGSSMTVKATFQRLRHQPSVARAGLLYPLSKSPGLTSCDNQLSDVPRAAPYVRAAETSWVSGQYTTVAAIDAVFVSDDPLDTRMLIVSAQVSTGVTYLPPGVPANHIGGPFMHTRGVAAVIDRHTYVVTSTGFDPWENGE